MSYVAMYRAEKKKHDLTKQLLKDALKQISTELEGQTEGLTLLQAFASGRPFKHKSHEWYWRHDDAPDYLRKAMSGDFQIFPEITDHERVKLMLDFSLHPRRDHKYYKLKEAEEGRDYAESQYRDAHQAAMKAES